MSRRIVSTYVYWTSLTKMVFVFSMLCVGVGCRHATDPLQTMTITGQIVDESRSPVSGAFVASNGITATSDAQGHYTLSNVDVRSPDRTIITCSNAGYFNAAVTAGPDQNGKTVVDIDMISLGTPQTVTAHSAATVSVTGAHVDLPADRYVTKTHAVYTGDLHVCERHLDPTTTSLANAFPDVTNPTGNGIISYGVICLQGFDITGEELGMTSGTNAPFKMTVPSTLLGQAPTNINLLYFDTAELQWVQRGTATLVDSEYVGSISQFGNWTCAEQAPTISCGGPFTYIVGNDIPDNHVWLSPDGTLLAVSNSQRTNFFSATTGSLVSSIPVAWNSNSTVQFSKDNARVLTIGNESASVWQVSGAQLLRQFTLVGGESILLVNNGTQVLRCLDSIRCFNVSDSSRSSVLGYLRGSNAHLESLSSDEKSILILDNIHGAYTLTSWDLSRDSLISQVVLPTIPNNLHWAPDLSVFSYRTHDAPSGDDFFDTRSGVKLNQNTFTYPDFSRAPVMILHDNAHFMTRSQNDAPIVYSIQTGMAVDSIPWMVDTHPHDIVAGNSGFIGASFDCGQKLYIKYRFFP